MIFSRSGPNPRNPSILTQSKAGETVCIRRTNYLKHSKIHSKLPKMIMRYMMNYFGHYYLRPSVHLGRGTRLKVYGLGVPGSYDVPPPEPAHGYYALHLECVKTGVKLHVIYVGHQRGGTEGAPEYAEALRPGADQNHPMFEKVPARLKAKYEAGYRMYTEPALVRSLYGMETLLTRLLQRRLPDTVEVIGGLYALKMTPEVVTAIKVNERHDDHQCISCGKGDHTVVSHPKEVPVDLPWNQIVEQVRQQADKRVAEAERIAKKDREAMEAKDVALQNAPGVGQFTQAAQAAPTPATQYRGCE